MAAVKNPGKKFSHQVHEEAFDLYSQGIPGYRVAHELEARYGPDNAPSRETVRRWIHRNNWRRRREKIHHLAEQRADQTRAERAAHLVTRFEDLREKALDATSELKYKSAEGAVRSLATLQRVIEGLNLPGEGVISKDDLSTVVETIFQVLSDDEVLGPVLAQRHGPIMARIEARLESGQARLAESAVSPSTGSGQAVSGER